MWLSFSLSLSRSLSFISLSFHLLLSRVLKDSRLTCRTEASLLYRKLWAKEGNKHFCDPLSKGKCERVRGRETQREGEGERTSTHLKWLLTFLSSFALSRNVSWVVPFNYKCSLHILRFRSHSRKCSSFKERIRERKKERKNRKRERKHGRKEREREGRKLWGKERKWRWEETCLGHLIPSLDPSSPSSSPLTLPSPFSFSWKRWEEGIEERERESFFPSIGSCLSFESKN